MVHRNDKIYKNMCSFFLLIHPRFGFLAGIIIIIINIIISFFFQVFPTSVS